MIRDRVITHVVFLWTLAALPLLADNTSQQVSLLRTAKLLRSTFVGDATKEIAKLNDGLTATTAQLQAKSKPAAPVTVDLVFELAEESTAKRLAILLGESNTSDAEADTDLVVEVLASSISANAGYQSLRQHKIAVSAKPQFYPLPDVGAKWLMIRISTNRTVGIKELGIYGHPGPPRTNYAFKESPAGALSVLSGLKSQVKAKLPFDEEALFADAADRKLDDYSFAEASLIAGGVPAEQRVALLKQIDELEAKAKAAVADQKTPFDKGRKLLSWLHAEVMKGGYDAHQTDVGEIFKTGKFNCVSSATLYNILGLRLGLDVRAVEVPDHAFSILYDGADHVDVQTTHPLGFDPEGDKRAQQQVQAQTGFDYVDDSQVNLRRELRELGLVGIIYYNHGVGHSDEKEFEQALRCYFSSLSLEPNLNSSINNSLATLANWGLELSKAKNFDASIDVLEVGRKLAPQDATLRNNYHVTWRQWIMSAVDQGKSAEAAALLDRARRAAPDGNFDAMQSWVYIGPGEKLVKEKDWQQALDVAAAGINRPLGEAALQELKLWRDGVIHRWWEDQLSSSAFPQAAIVLEKGMKLSPTEKRFQQNLLYTIERWAETTLSASGTVKAETILAAALKRYPAIAEMKEVAANYYFRTSEALRNKSDYRAATALAKRGIQLLPKEPRMVELGIATYAMWSQHLSKAGKVQEAADVLSEARKQFPNEKGLAAAGEGLYDQQMREFAAQSKWAEAVALYEKAIDRFPDSKAVRQNYIYLAQELTKTNLAKEGYAAGIQTLVAITKKHANFTELHDIALALTYDAAMSDFKADKHQEAVAIADRGANAFPQIPRMGEIAKELYGRRMNALVKAASWEDAITTGTAASARFPKDSSFANNTKYCYGKWAQQHVDAKQWPPAIEILNRAVKQFPNDPTLQRHLKYCQQQLQQANPK